MIARIVFDDGATETVLVLSDKGSWSGPEPWKTHLNQLARSVDLSPSRGFPYHAHVLRVAEQLGAMVIWEEKPEPAPDTVY